MLRAKYRKTAVVGTAAAVLFVSGCSTLPNNTGPQVVGTYQQQPEGPVSYTHLTLPTNREV